MDFKTRERLTKIMKSIPKEMLKKGMRTESTDNSKTMEAIEYMAKKGNKMAENLLKSGALEEKPRQVIDTKGAADIDAFVETKIADAMRSGDLKPVEKDDFKKRIEDNIQRNG